MFSFRKFKRSLLESRSNSSVSRIFLVVLALVVVFVNGSAMAAPRGKVKPYLPSMSCREAQNSDLWSTELPGWTLFCQRPVDQPKNGVVLGVTYSSQKIIVVDDSLDSDLFHNVQAGVLSHEIGHAWAVEHLSDSQKREFVARLGKKVNFHDKSNYESSPEEIWARSWSRCSGAGENSAIAQSGTVSCVLLRSVGVPSRMFLRTF